jgi:type IV pilus assembly protein PilW
MQFLYGVDTEDKGTVTEYRKANQMDVNNDGFIDSEDWLKVLTVKIELLFVSQRPVFSEPQTVVFDGVNYVGVFMRQVVSTTIQIRNKNT